MFGVSKQYKPAGEDNGAEAPIPKRQKMADSVHTLYEKIAQIGRTQGGGRGGAGTMV